ncbi:hypothetical protein EJ06DRAFT_517461 [Trichodelitschia bisporula]|uniref:ACB domain-containing protein n=1 Tax=Trichodelitschia bisporula TaxID=703511 RepID=A0A6G1HI95_9PEZI|nr:hypothetical protein EJ06DRAFT_517461 [Trichodelitschia bisporula]
MPTFEEAAASARNLKHASNDELLELYSYFKIGNGEDISKSNPGTFDLAGKAKKRAWQKKLDEGVTKEQARQKYVATFERLKAEPGLK